MHAYTLMSEDGSYVEIISLGAAIRKLVVPDRNGNLTDVSLGYEDIGKYESNPDYFGAVLGRNANRIAGACFTLNGREYTLAKNDGENNLHSGPDGFERKTWTLIGQHEGEDAASITLLYRSPDGDSGFPGNLDVKTTYTFDKDKTLTISYEAAADQDTLVNLTNHNYYNLRGEGNGDILSHQVRIYADYFSEVVPGLIPTGKMLPVEGTPLDFRTEKEIGRDIGQDSPLLKVAGGYDHNFFLSDYRPGAMALAAEAYCPENGIGLKVSTTCPCLHLYTGNFIGREEGKNGHVYTDRQGFAFEAHLEPDAVHKANIVSSVLKKGETYRQKASYQFFVR